MGFAGINRQQLWALFISILMVGSILGVMSLSGDDSTTNPDAPPIVTDAPTTISYSATGVESKVIQLFSTGIMVAQTSAFSSQDVDKELLKVDGIVSSQSMFLDEGNSVRSDIRVSSPDKFQSVLEQMKKLSTISEVQFYPKALVQLPEEIELTNDDLNLNLNYKFVSRQTEAVVTTATLQGDEILISIEGDFQKDLLVGKAFVIEVNNITASPEYYSATGEFEVASLDNSFLLSATALLSERQNIDSLLQELNELDENNSIAEMPVYNELLVMFVDSASFEEQDLNNFLTDFNVDAFTLYTDYNAVSVSFSEETNFVEFRDALKEGLNSNGFEIKELKEPNVSISGNINTNQEIINSKILEFSEKNFESLNLKQKVTFDSNSIYVADENKSFPLEAGFFEANLAPKYTEGEKVNLSMQLVVQRGKIVDTIGVEETKEIEE